jgi:nucleoside-diphosphate-sugar epimerase
MDVLITGSSGFLGKILTKKLGNKYRIIELSRNSGKYQISLEKNKPEFKEVFDLVIHAAGKAHVVSKNETEKQQFYDVNVTGTENLLRGLEKRGIPKQFVFISSVSVYGKEFGIGITEEHKLEAENAYGVSKIKAEVLVMEWCNKHAVVCTILRLPLLVGENPPGNLGAMKKAINKSYYFNIGGGKARKSMVLAEDVADFIPRVAQIGGIYNLTDGVHPNFYELSSVISRQKNRQGVYNLPITMAKMMGFVGDLLGDKAPFNTLKLKKITSDLTFDDSKARKLLNWKPESVLDYLKREKI